MMWIYDFDGVLLNSLDEVTVSAYNAVTEELVMSLAQLPDTLVNMFKRNRFHFQPAGDVIPLMNWCLSNHMYDPGKLLTRSEYEHIIQGTDVSLLDRTSLFYATRKRFIQKDIQRWFSLNLPYQPLWNELIHRGGENVVILTNKNRDAVLTLCRHFGLKVMRDNIYAGDNGATKSGNLDSIFKRFQGCSLCFIDDSLRNLQDLNKHFNSKKMHLRLFFASWGFIGPDDVQMALAGGYPVLNQTDLIRYLDT